jgi:hypothetical protein
LRRKTSKLITEVIELGVRGVESVDHARYVNNSLVKTVVEVDGHYEKLAANWAYLYDHEQILTEDDAISLLHDSTVVFDRLLATTEEMHLCSHRVATLRADARCDLCWFRIRWIDLKLQHRAAKLRIILRALREFFPNDDPRNRNRLIRQDEATAERLVTDIRRLEGDIDRARRNRDSGIHMPERDIEEELRQEKEVSVGLQEDLERRERELKASKAAQAGLLEATEHIEDAATVYADLVEMEQGNFNHFKEINNAAAARASEIQLLSFKHKFILMQLDLHRDSGENREAARSVWTARKRLLGEFHEDTRASCEQYCSILRQQKKFTDAATIHRGLWEFQTTPPEWRFFHGNQLAAVLVEQGRLEEAALQLKYIWQRRQRAQGRDDEDTIFSAIQYANMLERLGKLDDRDRVFQDVWTSHVDLANSPNMLAVGHKLGQTLYKQNKDRHAENVLGPVWQAEKATLEGGDAKLIQTGYAYGDVLHTRNNLPQAERVLREVWEMLKPDDKLLADLGHRLGKCLAKQSMDQEAAEILAKTWARRKELFGADNPGTLATAKLLAQSLMNYNNWAAALKVSQDIYLKEKIPENAFNYASCCRKENHLPEATELLEYVWTTWKYDRELGPSDVRTVLAGRDLGACWLERGDKTKAREVLEKVLAASKMSMEGSAYTAEIDSLFKRSKPAGQAARRR